MKTYNYLVYKDRIKPLAPQKGVSGNIGYYECTFEFDSDWGSLLLSLSAVAVFVGEIAYTAKIIDGKCIVPHEVLKENGEIYIGVYATNGNKDNLLRISTNLIPFEVEEGAFREGNLPIEPSPDVWETYIAAMNQTLIDTRDARDKANEYSVVAKNEADNAKKEVENAKTEVNNAKAEVENAKAEVKKAEQAKIGAEEYKRQATESAELSASHKDEAWRAVQMADGAAGSASGYALASQGFRNETEEFKKQAQSYVVGAGMNAEKAEKAAENASKSEFESSRYAKQAKADAEEIRNESENLVHKDNAEEIPGVKNFTNGIKTARITSDGALELKTLDNSLTIYANGTYEFYDGTIYINGESIKTDSPVYLLVTTDQVITKKIQGDSETGYLEIQSDGVNINSGSGVNISAQTGVNIETNGSYFLIDGKPIATKEYVNEVIKDVEGGSITIDDVPTEGSTNAVSSGGVKSYVDSSIQQAILDSWAEVIEP